MAYVINGAFLEPLLSFATLETINIKQMVDAFEKSRHQLCPQKVPQKAPLIPIQLYLAYDEFGVTSLVRHHMGTSAERQTLRHETGEKERSKEKGRTKSERGNVGG